MFAIAALPALIAHYDDIDDWPREAIAGIAYEYADEMLEARRK